MAFVKAVGHPIRSKIIVILDHRQATTAELAAEIGAPVRTVRHHLGVLRDGGFVQESKSDMRRNVRRYRFVASAFGHVETEIYEGLSARERRNLVNHYLRVMTRGIGRFVSAGTTYDEHFPSTARIPLTVDEEGWRRLTELCEETMEKAVALGLESAERLAAKGETGIEAELDLIAFEVPPPDPIAD